MAKVQELSKVEFDADSGMYLVKILSSAIGKWIVVSECHTEQQAKADQKMFAA